MRPDRWVTIISVFEINLTLVADGVTPTVEGLELALGPVFEYRRLKIGHKLDFQIRWPYVC